MLLCIGWRLVNCDLTFLAVQFLGLLFSMCVLVRVRVRASCFTGHPALLLSSVRLAVLLPYVFSLCLLLLRVQLVLGFRSYPSNMALIEQVRALSPSVYGADGGIFRFCCVLYFTVSTPILFDRYSNGTPSIHYVATAVTNFFVRFFDGRERSF